MQTPSDGSSADQSPTSDQVCISCRIRKKKCDRLLPQCSGCLRRDLICEYSTPEQTCNFVPTSTLTSTQPWHNIQIPVNYDHVDAQSISFSAMLFLDPYILQQGQIDMPQPGHSIPGHILHLLGDITSIHQCATEFFSHDHTWMSFISKPRFYSYHLPCQSTIPNRPETILLLLSIKLITTLPPTNPRNPQTSLYQAIKHYCLEVETSNVPSLPILQAEILIALYEMGHGIYPAAYLSIGACARRRVWWAIVILDRFVSIGSPGRPFATSDPSLDDTLPCDDEAWNQGIINSSSYSTLSSPTTGHMSKFALICQAARLLGQVLNHVSGASSHDDELWMQLDRTVTSMLEASVNVENPDCNRIAFIYSTLLALHTSSLSPHPANPPSPLHQHRTERKSQLLQRITQRIIANVSTPHSLLGRDPKSMSLWGLFFAYHMCVEQIRSKDPSSHDIVVLVRKGFEEADVRWNVAGVYLRLLEAHEVMDGY
ncbi:putative fungal specific transcription protein [Botrytis fragariae]|uniref:Putative fungal specific transcription protein n=1 Tax=Botrytis fragariae TaxID=1964551 RepID=A0A8H6AHR7_9HELO|nr:putative fungal specific transcription protein [Botrytis fragariae]KAF5867418.1 putative fungal specific transcription protein [Botrytis fragariae]